MLSLLLLFFLNIINRSCTSLSAVNNIIALKDSRNAIALNRGKNAIVIEANIFIYGRIETGVVKLYSLLAVNCYKLLN